MIKAKDPKELLAKEKLTLEETAYFSRKDTVVSGVPPQVLRVARGLARKGKWYEEPVLAGEAYYLIRLSELKPADPEKFASEKERLKTQLTNRKRQEAFSAWYRSLRAKAEVKLYRELPEL